MTATTKVTALHYCLLSEPFATREAAMAFRADNQIADPVETYWFTTDGDQHSTEAAAERVQRELDRQPADLDGYNMAGVEHRLPGQAMADVGGAQSFRAYCREMGANS